MELIAQKTQETKNKVLKVLSKQLGVDVVDIKPESSLVGDLGVDSLDQVELVMDMEDAFDIFITDDEGEKLTTVQQVFDLVAEKTKEK